MTHYSGYKPGGECGNDGCAFAVEPSQYAERIMLTHRRRCDRATVREREHRSRVGRWPRGVR